MSDPTYYRRTSGHAEHLVQVGTRFLMGAPTSYKYKGSF